MDTDDSWIHDSASAIWEALNSCPFKGLAILLFCYLDDLLSIVAIVAIIAEITTAAPHF